MEIVVGSDAEMRDVGYVQNTGSTSKSDVLLVAGSPTAPESSQQRGVEVASPNHGEEVDVPDEGTSPHTPHHQPETTSIEERDSMSSSTVSSVSSVSEGSGHWSDSAVEEGPGPSSAFVKDTAHSDGGRDSKRKKLQRGLASRRTKARR